MTVDLHASLSPCADSSATRTVVALVPAHNEEAGIGAAIDGLAAQDIRPDRVIVVADNCTDSTAVVAAAAGAEVHVTVGNTHKKAGALNQVLATLLPTLDDKTLVLVQDADSSLDPGFIAAAAPYAHSPVYGAVGGVFRGEGGSGFVGHLQANEYARYGRDVRNLGGLCLVVTGTAAVFRAGVLREVSAARLAGRLPTGDGLGGVYDTSVLTEDNELSFALQTLGYRLISPRGCLLATEIMPTWRALWRQRLRWKRGAVENCLQYGWSRVTRRYWMRQIVTALGVVVSAAYLASVLYGLVAADLAIRPLWLAVTGIFMLERAVTVADRGWRHALASLTLYELVLDFFLQACHAKAFWDVARRAERRW